MGVPSRSWKHPLGMLCVVSMSFACTTAPPHRPAERLVEAAPAPVVTPPLDPNRPPSPASIASLRMGQRSYSRGEFGAARFHVDVALMIDPRHEIAHFDAGVLDEQRGAPERARSHYRRAAQAPGRFAPPHVNLGRLAYASGEVDQARRHFEDALAEDDRSAMAHHDLSVVLREQGVLEDALRHARRSLQLDPAYLYAYTNIALIRHALGQRELALRTLDEAARAFGARADIWNTRGVLVAGEDWMLAIEHFRAALALDPEHVPALMNMGALMSETHAHLEALALFERVLALRPGDVDARLEIAAVRAHQGDLYAAERIYLEVREEHPDEHRVLFKLGVMEQEHFAPDRVMGAGTDPPLGIVAQLRWNAANFERAAESYESAVRYYEAYLKAEGEGAPYAEEAALRARRAARGADHASATARDLYESADEIEGRFGP